MFVPVGLSIAGIFGKAPDINVWVKQKFPALLVALALLSTTIVAKADSYEDKVKASTFYATILEAAKTKRGREMVDFLDKSVEEEAGRAHAASLWLRDNSIEQQDVSKINSLFFLAYADTLGTIATSYKESGQPDQYRALLKPQVLNLYIFELMASVDAVRCQDPTALIAVSRGMASPRANDLGREVFATLTRDDFDTIEKSAMAEEEKMKSRPANLDICSLGQARLRDLAAAPGVKQREVRDPRYKSGLRTVLVPPEGYTFVPSIVAQDEWLEARKNALSEVTTRWAKRYTDMTRPN